MIDFITPILFLGLLGIIGGQAFIQHRERLSWQEQEGKLVTAFLSKDATEFAHAIKTEKEIPEKQENIDEVELTNADDEVFDKYIKQQTAQ